MVGRVLWAVGRVLSKHRLGWWGSLGLAYIFQWGAFNDYPQFRAALMPHLVLPEHPTWWLWATPLIVWIIASMLWHEVKSELTSPRIFISPYHTPLGELRGHPDQKRRFWKFSLSNEPIWRTAGGVASKCHVIASVYRMGLNHKLGEPMPIQKILTDESCPWRECVETGKLTEYALDIPGNGMVRDFLVLTAGEPGSLWHTLRNSDVENYSNLDERRILKEGNYLIRLTVQAETINEKFVAWFCMLSRCGTGRSKITHIALDLDEPFDLLVWNNLDQGPWLAESTSA